MHLAKFCDCFSFRRSVPKLFSLSFWIVCNNVTQTYVIIIKYCALSIYNYWIPIKMIFTKCLALSLSREIKQKSLRIKAYLIYHYCIQCRKVFFWSTLWNMITSIHSHLLRDICILRIKMESQSSLTYTEK